MVLQPTVKLLIDGQFVDSKTKDWIEVKNPATQVGVVSPGTGVGWAGAPACVQGWPLPILESGQPIASNHPNATGCDCTPAYHRFCCIVEFAGPPFSAMHSLSSPLLMVHFPEPHSPGSRVAAAALHSGGVQRGRAVCQGCLPEVACYAGAAACSRHAEAPGGAPGQHTQLGS